MFTKNLENPLLVTSAIVSAVLMPVQSSSAAPLLSIDGSETESAAAKELQFEFEPSFKFAPYPKSSKRVELLVADAESEPESDQPNANSNETESEESDDKWQFFITPYLFLPTTFEADITVNDISVTVDQSLGELLGDLSFAFSSRFEAWNGRLGIIFDSFYIKLKKLRGRNLSTPNLSLGLDSTVNTQQGIFDLAFSYHIGQLPPGKQPGSSEDLNFPVIWFEPIAGLRINYLQSSIQTEGELGIFERSFDFDKRVSEDKLWLAPMIGGRIGLQFSEKLTLGIRGDVSGLDPLASLNWNFYSGLDWQLTNSTSLVAAYRIYDLGFGNVGKREDLGINLREQGPWLGVSFQF